MGRRWVAEEQGGRQAAEGPAGGGVVEGGRAGGERGLGKPIASGRRGEPSEVGRGGWGVSDLDVLRGRRLELVARWCEAMFASYPEASGRFYATERDPFRNPVGATLRSSAATLVDAVLAGEWGEGAEAALDAVVRLRSVQGFSPSQAVGFVRQLKECVRQLLADSEEVGPAVLSALDERIDALLLRSFDRFVACRDRLHELKEREVKARVHTLLQRAGMLDEPEDPTAPTAAPEGSSR